MKKILVVSLIVVFMLVGCAWFQANQGNICLTAGTAVGMFVAEKYPAQAPLILQTAQGVLADLQAAKITGADFSVYINDLLAQCNMDADLKLLIVAAVDSISVTWTTGQVNTDAESVVQGVINGLQTAKIIKANKALRG